MKFSGEFTCIRLRNLMGSDSPLMPTPVHKECWEKKGKPLGYERAEFAQRFVVEGRWVESLPPHTKCALCKEEIEYRSE